MSVYTCVQCFASLNIRLGAAVCMSGYCLDFNLHSLLLSDRHKSKSKSKSKHKHKEKTKSEEKDEEQHKHVEQVEGMDVPLLLMHSEKDQVVKMKYGEQLRDYLMHDCKCTNVMWNTTLIPCTSHTNYAHWVNDEEFERFDQLLEKVLASPVVDRAKISLRN